LLARFAALAPTDRVTLLADSFALAQAGQQPLARHFDWLAQLPTVHDSARAPLFALALQQIEMLEQALEGLPAAATVRAAARSLFAPELRRIGWQPAADEDPEVTRLRGTLITSLARLDDMEVVAAARERFGAAMAPGGALPGSIRAAVIHAVGHHADASQTDALWRALRATEDQEERWQLVAALAATRDSANAQRLLDAALQDWLPPDVAAYLPGLVSEQPQHAALAYRFAVARWPQLAQRAGSGVFGARARLLPDAAEGLVERADAERLRLDQQRLAGATGAVAAERVAARIELRAALREREAERLAGVLGAWRPLPG
jgi:ERAP1-like C-terminal domain